jgi:diketogulonate reductase-like aldo/keto reductase
LAAIANDLGVTLAQLAIRYCVEKGTIPLPKSTHESRILENAALDFSIPSVIMTELDAMDPK